jgi:hypothetical protein
MAEDDTGDKDLDQPPEEEAIQVGLWLRPDAEQSLSTMAAVQGISKGEAATYCLVVVSELELGILVHHWTDEQILEWAKRTAARATSGDIARWVLEVIATPTRARGIHVPRPEDLEEYYAAQANGIGQPGEVPGRELDKQS